MRAALAVGIVDSSTSRDESWQFFTLGRSIERADMTARLLATRSLTEASGPSWTTILRSCGAYEAYLRTYRGIPSARNAAEFLLLDRLFPRSIIYSIQRAEDLVGIAMPTMPLSCARTGPASSENPIPSAAASFITFILRFSLPDGAVRSRHRLLQSHVVIEAARAGQILRCAADIPIPLWQTA